MDQLGFQQTRGWSAPLSDQQNHLVAQPGDGPEDLSLTPTGWCNSEWNSVGCSQNAIDAPSQAVPLFTPQPHSNSKPHPGLIRHWYEGYAASSSFRWSPDADLPLSAVDVERQTPANDRSSQQTLLLCPYPKKTAELNSILIPYGDTHYESTSSLEQALTAGPALATQRFGEPHSNPRQNSGRCVRCWALRKAVILFIQ